MDQDYELQSEVRSCVTKVDKSQPQFETQRFERFSDWKKLVCAIVGLQSIARDRHHISPSAFSSAYAYITAENFIIRQVQCEYYAVDIQRIHSKMSILKDSPLYSLNPFVDEDGMLRIGGRLNKAELEVGLKNPLIIPGRHHIALLLVRMYHEQVNHQGRHFREGAVRAAGLWITSGKRLINSVIFKCVKCRKLRGRGAEQKMADLPEDRLTPCPPFTFVRVDTFGPWSVTTRRTRGGQANSKHWALLFTCLVIRAVHIEVIDELSTSAFINMLRRFISIRGKMKEFRSDRGTNFTGACSVLNVNVINVEDEPIKRFLSDNKASWIFNPPQASHMGGVWERMIGVVRRILDSMLANVSHRNLTQDVLTTLMAEICAIVNARPIVPVSSDPEVPGILSPSSLLTLKSDHAENLVTNCNMTDLYQSQWRLVQALAEQFWSRWKTDYLHTLQARRKWFDSKPNIEQGDVVLLREKDTVRNEWPIGLVENAIQSEDGKIRKAVIRVIRKNSVLKLTRPITELVLLMKVSANDK
ncbi:uncharacterized protein LOC124257539 [Haliotis rubra]|uniref:uncharacterized protein LOC124257539 n=1 Tax=Haliotis rubra TaxID=36100 RepID=UPI001EE58419|nr:uncharacterized protein LOC124257539 [Haliotis rubra]